MRTRMYGGVRGRGFVAPSYSITYEISTSFYLIRDEDEVAGQYGLLLFILIARAQPRLGI